VVFKLQRYLYNIGLLVSKHYFLCFTAPKIVYMFLNRKYFTLKQRTEINNSIYFAVLGAQM